MKEQVWNDMSRDTVNTPALRNLVGFLLLAVEAL